MAETIESGKVCRACGTMNDVEARSCTNCGARLEDAQESPESAHFVDDDPALRYVDPNNRVEVERFERLDEAELACGLLRSNGIACELSSMVLPGLPGEVILWTHARDAEMAWALLADAEREASTKKDDDAA